MGEAEAVACNHNNRSLLYQHLDLYTEKMQTGTLPKHYMDSIPSVFWY